jgi:hypothetical protein
MAGALAVNGEIDLMELAGELAEIARKTSDPATGGQLIRVVNRLLTEAGLPPGVGGGGTPDRWLSEPVCGQL